MLTRRADAHVLLHAGRADWRGARADGLREKRSRYWYAKAIAAPTVAVEQPDAEEEARRASRRLGGVLLLCRRR